MSATPSVDALTRYLAEWYRPEVTGAPIADLVDTLEEAAARCREEGATVHLIAAMAVPSDEVFYGLYAAQSADDVTAACHRAGIPAERLTGGVAAHISRIFEALGAEPSG